MKRTDLIVSVKEARELLGEDAADMSDEEIASVIQTLDSLAKASLEEAKTRLKMKKDAEDLANLIYDIYQDKKKAEK